MKALIMAFKARSCNTIVHVQCTVEVVLMNQQKCGRHDRRDLNGCQLRSGGKCHCRSLRLLLPSKLLLGELETQRAPGPVGMLEVSS